MAFAPAAAPAAAGAAGAKGAAAAGTSIAQAVLPIALNTVVGGMMGGEKGALGGLMGGLLSAGTQSIMGGLLNKGGKAGGGMVGPVEVGKETLPTPTAGGASLGAESAPSKVFDTPSVNPAVEANSALQSGGDGVPSLGSSGRVASAPPPEPSTFMSAAPLTSTPTPATTLGGGVRAPSVTAGTSVAAGQTVNNAPAGGTQGDMLERIFANQAAREDARYQRDMRSKMITAPVQGLMGGMSNYFKGKAEEEDPTPFAGNMDAAIARGRARAQARRSRQVALRQASYPTLRRG